MTFILTTTIIWVIVLFMILPFYVEVPNNPELGHASSAPVKPHIGRKLLISLLISTALATCFFMVNF
jgi:predicted secreted protein